MKSSMTNYRVEGCKATSSGSRTTRSGRTNGAARSPRSEYGGNLRSTGQQNWDVQYQGIFGSDLRPFTDHGEAMWTPRHDKPESEMQRSSLINEVTNEMYVELAF